MYKMSMEKSKRYVVTKKIAKHGSQAIIVIPRILEESLKPGTVVQVTLDVISENKGGENGG